MSKQDRIAVQSGFTLIELLVVIAIIALLVSILLPSLNKAKELAKAAVCSSQLKGLHLSVNLYAEDYDGTLVNCYGTDGGATYNYFWEPLSDYDVDINTVTCPTEDKENDASITPWHYYGVNLWFYRAYAPGQTGWQVKRSEVCNPAYVSYLADTHPPAYSYSIDARAIYPPANLSSEFFRMNFGARHSEKANVLWFDGHVSPHTAEWFRCEDTGASNRHIDWGEFQS